MSADTMINVHQPGGLAPVPVLPWDGMWNLDDDAEMLVMLQTLALRHKPALLMINGEWQMGWRGKVEVWGMRLPCPRRAIRDATERLFKRIKGRDVVNGDYPPNPGLPGVRTVEVLALAESWQKDQVELPPNGGSESKKGVVGG